MSESMFTLMVETAAERACFRIFSKNGRARIDGDTFWREAKSQERS
jgi:hypothetical protein